MNPESGLAAEGFLLLRVIAVARSSKLKSRRSRKLGTIFRSPVTTFAPFRGQRSRPAPSLPRRSHYADPFDRKLLRSVRFSKPNPGEFLAPDPLSAPFTGAVMTLPGLRSPSGPFETLRIKAFSRIRRHKSTEALRPNSLLPAVSAFQRPLQFARSQLLVWPG